MGDILILELDKIVKSKTKNLSVIKNENLYLENPVSAAFRSAKNSGSETILIS